MKEYGFLLNNNEKQTREIIIVKAEDCKVQFPYWDEESKRVWYPLQVDNAIIEFTSELLEL